LRCGLIRLGARPARMLASPRADLGGLEDAVMVRVHLVELGRRPPPRPLLDPLDVLLAGEAADA